MKYFIIVLLLISVVTAIELGEGGISSVTSNSVTSKDIKDIVRGDLMRDFGSDYFKVEVNKLPKYNDIPFLSFEMSDKVINIKPNSLTVDGMLIKPSEPVLYMPYTKYLLSKNLIVKDSMGLLTLTDDSIEIRTEEINIIDGIVYLHPNKLKIRVMPYMVVYRFRQLTKDGITKVEMNSKKDGLTYKLTAKTKGKLFLFKDVNMNVIITIDAITGKIKYNKPWWAIFSKGEMDTFKNFNATEVYAF